MIHFSNDQSMFVQKLLLFSLDLRRLGKFILKWSKVVPYALIVIVLLPAILVAMFFINHDNDYDGGNW